MTQQYDFEIEQGTDVSVNITLKNTGDNSPRDLTGVTPVAKMKLNRYQDTGESFSAIVNSPATDGIVNLSLSNQRSSLLNPRWKYMYEVQISYSDSDDTIIETPLKGTITVNPEVI